MSSSSVEKIENPLIKLQDLAHFLASGNLDENMNQQATMTAKIVGAQNCSIMLINDGEGEGLRMSICANYGLLPLAALKESIDDRNRHNKKETAQ